MVWVVDLFRILSVLFPNEVHNRIEQIIQRAANLSKINKQSLYANFLVGGTDICNFSNVLGHFLTPILSNKLFEINQIFTRKWRQITLEYLKIC